MCVDSAASGQDQSWTLTEQLFPHQEDAFFQNHVTPLLAEGSLVLLPVACAGLWGGNQMTAWLGPGCRGSDRCQSQPCSARLHKLGRFAARPLASVLPTCQMETMTPQGCREEQRPAQQARSMLSAAATGSSAN